MKPRGDIFLPQKEDYYAQIQGQLYLTGTKYCDLAVWTLKDFVIIRIERNPAWAENIAKLIRFYYERFYPMFAENSTPSEAEKD